MRHLLQLLTLSLLLARPAVASACRPAKGSSAVPSSSASSAASTSPSPSPSPSPTCNVDLLADRDTTGDLQGWTVTGNVVFSDACPAPNTDCAVMTITRTSSGELSQTLTFTDDDIAQTKTYAVNVNYLVPVAGVSLSCLVTGTTASGPRTQSILLHIGVASTWATHTGSFIAVANSMTLQCTAKTSLSTGSADLNGISVVLPC